ncbi:MAG: spermine synthase [Marinilabiliaceae bacterium]
MNIIHNSFFDFRSNPKLLKGSATIFVSGFTMLMTQVVMLREVSSLYSVNELIVGVFLAFWMLFMGAGAFVARYFKGHSWACSGLFPLVAGLMAWVSLWILYLAHEWVVPSGRFPGIMEWLWVTALITFVFCFPSGMMFTWFSSILTHYSGKRRTEGIYISEQLGSLVAGILFYLFSSWWLNAFSVISFLLIVNLLVAVFLFLPDAPKMATGVSILLFGALLFFSFVPQYQTGREVIHEKAVHETLFSPYGNVDVLEESEDPEFFGNGRFFSGSLLPREREELLHPAFQLNPDPRRVLLVNTGPGLLSEALKYDSLLVHFVSPDISRLELEKRLLEFSSETVCNSKFIQSDPVLHLSKENTPDYDVVLVGGGIPSTLAETRFYTSNFFQLVSRKLAPDGVMMTGGLPWMASWSESRRNILQILHQTVQDVFPHIRIWAGEKVFFIASHRENNAEWWTHHPEVLSENQFFREDFFPGYVVEEQTKQINEMVSSAAPVNTRVRPVLFRQALDDLSDFWDVGIHGFVVVVGGMFVLGLFFYRGGAGGVFLTGFALGGVQVVLLLFWQMTMGDMYRATGLLFSLLMAGFAVGAFLGKRKFFIFHPRYFPVMMMILALLNLGAVPMLDAVGRVFWFPVVTGMIVLALAVAGGSIFTSGVALDHGSVARGASRIYSADVAGGALGSFLIAIFFVPYSGLINTGYLLGLMLLIGGLLHLKRL